MKRGDRMDMIESAIGALKWVIHLKEGDKMLVVVDDERRKIGEAFLEGGRRIGGDVGLYALQGRRPFVDVPQDLKEMVKGKDVIINVFTGIPEETPFRIDLAKIETDAGAKVGHAPGITEDMMTNGPMIADYQKVSDIARRLMAMLKNATTVHVTAPAGTDIVLSISGRKFDTDVSIEKGHIGNLPSGEIWCAPVEDGADGTIVCDGSVGNLGQVPSPLRIEVVRGRIESLEGDERSFVSRISELIHVDEMASVIGELGIGVNPMARITGQLLEDEKAGRTSHIAFGNNENMPGGKNNSRTHRDFLFHAPTLVVTYSDGRVGTVMEDGDLRI